MGHEIVKWLRVVLYSIVLLLLGFFIRGRCTSLSQVQHLSLVNSTIQKSTSPTSTTTYSPDLLGNAWDGYIKLIKIDQVNLSIDNTLVSLADALKSGKITVEELIAQAFTDARTGVCSRADWENKGLSRFDFRYKNFDMTITLDVYKTPLREKISVLALSFYPAGDATSHGVGQYIYDKNGNLIDRYSEDWGLDIQVTTVTPTTISLDITQLNGQQIGIIVVSHYCLLGKDANVQGPEKICTGEEFGQLSTLDAPITTNGKTKLDIDWSMVYGTLPSGEYTLTLSIQDEFSQEDVHPLMENYEENTRLFIPFIVA